MYPDSEEFTSFQEEYHSLVQDAACACQISWGSQSDSTHLTLIFLSEILSKPSAYLGAPIFHILLLPYFDDTWATARKIKTLPSKYKIAHITPV
jgi:hypothetical protein